MHLKEGEERTAGSDPGIRFSSGGPISLDPELYNIFYTIFASNTMYIVRSAYMSPAHPPVK
jgi:hypothetical protein